MDWSSSRGLSMLEMLIVVLISGLLIVALAVFATRGFAVPREHLEQFRITEDARRELKRVSETIRNAQPVDRNGDGRVVGSEEERLQAAEPYSIRVFVNVDDDSESELVTYEAKGDTLLRTVVKRDASGEWPAALSETSVVLGTLRNRQQQVPLFSYFAELGTAPLSAPVAAADRGNVALVGIRPVIDVSLKQYPPAAELYTAVAFRGSEVKCGQNPSKEVSEYDYADNFYEQGAIACRDYCQEDNAPPPGAFCPWYAVLDHFEAARVSAACQCETLALPSNDDPRWEAYGPGTSYDSASTFYRQCEVRCGGYATKICDFSDNDPAPPGRCICECPTQ